MATNELYPLILEPTVKNYVWGGSKFKNILKSGLDPNLPVAEIWVIYENNVVSNGYLAGKTLHELTSHYEQRLLGDNFHSKQKKFPLLIKLLDSKEWLSIQVHPNDKQAIELEGPTFNGKTEGWFVLDAEPETQLIAGLKPWIGKDQLSESIRNGNVTSIVKYHDIEKDNFIYIPAGTIHALGPGATIYEIQQNSDITYRVYDWDRPSTAGRPLHIDKSIAVTDLKGDVKLQKANQTTIQEIFSGDYFSLVLLQSEGKKISLDPNGESFHALTVIEGSFTLHSEHGKFKLNQFESILVPASYPPYQLDGKYKLLLGSLNNQ